MRRPDGHVWFHVLLLYQLDGGFTHVIVNWNIST